MIDQALFSRKQNKIRKKRIDVILRQHFNRRHLFDSDTDSDSDGLSDDGSNGFQNGLDLNGIGQVHLVSIIIMKINSFYQPN